MPKLWVQFWMSFWLVFQLSFLLKTNVQHLSRGSVLAEDDIARAHGAAWLAYTNWKLGGGNSKSLNFYRKFLNLNY